MTVTDVLAVDGGEPVRKSPFAPWPDFDEEMIAAVGEVLRSGRVNAWTGDQTRQFEAEFAEYCGTQFAIAVANGTVALELALEALGIGPGDEVVVPSRTFLATASSVVMRGATPVCADVDEPSQNVTADTIAAQLTDNTKAIIPVHLAGWPCDMDPIMDLAERHKLFVVEDCAQAHGATYRGQPVGSMGHVGCYSFCQDKILSTGGEGGMVVTNNEAVWKRAWSFKDHGKDWDAVHTPAPGAVFKWLHQTFGTNWRMTEMQSAIGRVLLRRLPDWVQQRRDHAGFLHDQFANLEGIETVIPDQQFQHSYYKFYGLLDTSRLRNEWTRDKVVLALQAEGIPCGSGACAEIYREGAFVNAGLGPAERLPVARRLGEKSIMFMVHPTLTEQDLIDTVKGLKKVLGTAICDNRS